MNDAGTISVITKEDLQKHLLSAGIDGEFIGKVIKDGLEASKKEGPDHSSRLKYLQLILELLDITKSIQKEEDSFELYRGKYTNLTDGQLQEEIEKALGNLRKFTA